MNTDAPGEPRPPPPEPPPPAGAAPDQPTLAPRKQIKLVRTPFVEAAARAAREGRLRPTHTLGRVVAGSRRRMSSMPSLAPLWGMIGCVAVLLLLVVLSVPSLRSGLLRPPGVAPLVPVEKDVGDSLRQLDAGRVFMPAQAFSIAAPAAWEQVTGLEAKPYDLTFQNERGVSISVMATPVKYDDLRSLSADIRRREKQRQLTTTPDVIRLGERQVIQRKVDLGRQKILALDFVENHVAYHALSCAPTKFYDAYEPLFLEVVKSLRAEMPVKPATAPLENDAAGTPGSG